MVAVGSSIPPGGNFFINYFAKFIYLADFLSDLLIVKNPNDNFQHVCWFQSCRMFKKGTTFYACKMYRISIFSKHTTFEISLMKFCGLLWIFWHSIYCSITKYTWTCVFCDPPPRSLLYSGHYGLMQHMDLMQFQREIKKIISRNNGIIDQQCLVYMVWSHTWTFAQNTRIRIRTLVSY